MNKYRATIYLDDEEQTTRDLPELPLAGDAIKLEGTEIGTISSVVWDLTNAGVYPIPVDINVAAPE